jgi:hypothetical protein
MIATTHRVVGVLEWPVGSEISPEVLGVLRREMLANEEPLPTRILSLRFPLSESVDSTAADLNQLRADLERLFRAFVDGSAC